MSRADKQLAQAVKLARTKAIGDDALGWVAFLSGYLETDFPELARAFHGVMLSDRTAWWPFPDGDEAP